MATAAASMPGAPPPPPPPHTAKSLPSKVYHGLVNSVDKHVPAKLRPLWVHPAGPKTIFFWAPIFKWTVVKGFVRDMLCKNIISAYRILFIYRIQNCVLSNLK